METRRSLREAVNLFSACCNRKEAYRRSIYRGIVSLHEFTALKEVQLDLLMIAAPPPVSDFRSRFRGVTLAADDESNVSGILPLSQTLPIAIERVSLVMHAGHGFEHGQSELDIVRKQLRTLQALFAADLTVSHPCLQQVARLRRGSGVVGVLIDDCRDAFELMPWEDEDSSATCSS